MVNVGVHQGSVQSPSILQYWKYCQQSSELVNLGSCYNADDLVLIADSEDKLTDKLRLGKRF